MGVTIRLSDDEIDAMSEEKRSMVFELMNRETPRHKNYKFDPKPSLTEQNDYKLQEAARNSPGGSEIMFDPNRRFR